MPLRYFLTEKSVQTKLLLAISTCGLLTLALMLFTLQTQERESAAHHVAEELSTLGTIIAQNSTATLVFNDTDAAKDTLASLVAVPNIISAKLYTREGQLFASFASPIKSKDVGNDLKGTTFDFASLGTELSQLQARDNYYEMTLPVTFDGESIGFLQLIDNQSLFYKRMEKNYVLLIYICLCDFLHCHAVFVTKLHDFHTPEKT